ncbi:MAG: sodium:solute symporter [bacterium]|nr:sodium:solute symporter [bacterium]
MILTPLDWSIVIFVFVIMLAGLFASRTHMRSVADFLSAGRSAGRYIIAVSSGVAGLGAITVVGNFEMNLLAGFSMSWWGMTMGIVVLFATVAGWVIYRFRQTRCLTLAQFFEIRYNRSFRIFTGIVAFVAGIINMGIFPAVEARFFLYFCGFPQTFELFGVEWSTFAFLMVGIISLALWFVFSGGQVAVIVADFLQGVFVNIAMVVIVLYFVFTIDWTMLEEALKMAPANQSMINPFHTSNVKDFNLWYFLIGVVGFLYSAMSWQGTQGYNSSAENAHEAKMAGVVGLWRGMPQNVMLAFIPIVAFMVLNHPAFSALAATIADQLRGVSTEAVRSQLKVPLVLQHLLPNGLIGAFAALMLCASITTINSYLHSWGSILVQDVILPIRKRPFETKQHLLILRLSILFVAIFIFFFSLLFKQTQYIFLFFAITGAIFAGGSGAVIIGGLYWKYGTAAAAWAAMLTGSAISVAGIIIHQYIEDFFINGQEFWGLSMFFSAAVFVIVSLLGKRKPYNFDKLFHRGQYAIPGEENAEPVAQRGWKVLGMGKEFTRGDRIIYIVNYVWTFAWFGVFIYGTIYNLSHEVSDSGWMTFWKIQLAINIGLAVVTVFWFTFGGFKDMGRMFKTLKNRKLDHTDDGFIRESNEKNEA